MKYFFIYGLVLFVFAIIFSIMVGILIRTSQPLFVWEKIDELQTSDSIILVVGGVKSWSSHVYCRDLEKYDTMHYRVKIIGFYRTIQYEEYRRKVGTEWIAEKDTLFILPTSAEN